MYQCRLNSPSFHDSFTLPLDHGSETICRPGFASPTTTSENFVGSWSRFCLIDTAAHSDYFALMRLLNRLLLLTHSLTVKNVKHVPHCEALALSVTSSFWRGLDCINSQCTVSTKHSWEFDLISTPPLRIDVSDRRSRFRRLVL